MEQLPHSEMASEDQSPNFFAEDRQFFHILQYFLDQLDQRPRSDPKEPLPNVFSNNHFGYLTSVLDRYQEQPYLLDPHLERMVQPIISRLRHCLENLQNHSIQFEGSSANLVDIADINQLSEKIQTISRLLYFIIKVRGYKTIVQFFPHQVSDLSIVISSFGLIFPNSNLESSTIVETFANPDLWPFRYVLLLWLSLICMIPFDLTRFDQLETLQHQKIQTYEYIQKVGWLYLGLPGKEREAAALVLARLMLREDVFQYHLLPFVKKSIESLKITGEKDVFLATGIVQVLCILIDRARPTQLLDALPLLHQAVHNANNLSYISSSISLRKLRAKLAGRVAEITPLTPPNDSELEDDQIPESIENTVQDLLDCLQDKDTVVRWSGAKYLARIGRRLPESFSTQICDAVLDLFSLKAVEEHEGKLDLLSVNDYTWQGACLACAEFLRQKSFPISRLQVLFECGIRALHFEQRKGVQTIGSGVRDAAAYVFWSFGRAFSPSDVAPFANQLAIQLVLQSLFDREVHIRRAGSAAFQENVGRLGMFPHGIEVLQRVDFFTVGLGRSAFLRAAPYVARFDEYREAILDHLLSVSVCNWDKSIRELASQSICLIVRTTFDKIPPSFLHRFESDLQSKDINKLHGTLLTLGELANDIHVKGSYKDTNTLLDKIFRLITCVLESKLKTSQLEMLLGAICQALSYTLPTSPDGCEKFLKSPAWMQLVDVGLKRSNNDLHCSLQSVLHHASLRGVGGEQIKFYLKTLTSSLIVARQASARCLGGFVFSSDPLKTLFKPTFDALAASAEPRPSDPPASIEVIRNSLESLVSIVVNLGDDMGCLLTQEQFSQLLRIVVNGLKNYTSDQRGDVGSWVRTSSLRSIENTIVSYHKSVESFKSQSSHPIQNEFPLKLDHQYLFNSIFSGILRQSLDSIDSVRQLAWQTMSRVLATLSTSDGFQIHSTILGSCFESTFDEKNAQHWRELDWTFPSSLNLLTKLMDLSLSFGNEDSINATPSSADLKKATMSLSNSLLEGIIILIGGKGNRDSKNAASSFADHVRQIGKSNKMFLKELVERILKLPRTRPSGSKNFTLCCWDAISLLLEADALKPLDCEDGGKIMQSILSMVTQGLDPPKVSLGRVITGSKIVVHLTGFKSIRIEAAHHLATFLSYNSARVRILTAEALYNAVQLQDEEVPETEELLSETNWSECSIETAIDISKQIVESLKNGWKMNDSSS